ncbi:MAG: ABC transporter ATP-binding protein [Nostoc sp. C3-bin3]|nr:ABC transporter ATP-binding protein [Nostoc sp. C3-bin3]
MTKVLTRLRSILPQLPYLTATIKLVWQAAGFWLIVWVILLIFQGIVPAIEINLVKTAINSFVSVVSANSINTSIYSPHLKTAFTQIGVLVGLMLSTGAIASFQYWVRSQISELTQDYVSSVIHRQAISLDLAFFESPDYYNHLHRACGEGKNQPVLLWENLGELAVSTLTLLSVAVVLLPLGIWLPLGLLLSSFPPFFAMYKSNQMENQWRLQNTMTQRYLDYYEQILTESEFAAEVRLFGLGDRFHNAYQNLRHQLRIEKMRLMRSRSLIQFLASCLSLIILGISLVWIVSQMARGQLSLGDLALLLQSLWLVQGLVQMLLRSCSKTYQNLLLLKDLFAFIQLQPSLINSSPKNKEITKTFTKRICFQAVSFAYPDSQHLALDNFNLTIPVGQIVAIVGENGAGKSTLTKLLCRFYDPIDGKITIDGEDIRNTPVAQLRQLFSVMFQSPARYHDTVINNMMVGVSSINPPTTDITTKIKNITQATGADTTITQLPAGYDTLLGKRFGGTELSGGQWQRLALGRTWLRSAPIVILDEPTSAMDTWAETNWLKSLRNLAQGKTVIIITHRLMTAQYADMIHVIAEGKVLESGTHQQLLAKGGNYAQSWQLQVEAEKVLS